MKLPISHRSSTPIVTSIGGLVGRLFPHLEIPSLLTQEVDLLNLSNPQSSIILAHQMLDYLNPVPLDVVLGTTTIIIGSMLALLGLDVITTLHPHSLLVTLLPRATSGIMPHKLRKWQ
jgi:hypothetical protein